jgi:hypothetical protein
MPIRLRHPRMTMVSALVLTGALLMGCTSLAPSRSLPTEQQSPLFKAPTHSAATATPSASPIPADATSEPTQIPDCTNGLEYLADLSIPDGMQLDPNTVFEKEWQVKNSGTCNWNNLYSIRLVSGSAFGANPTQAIVPARNGAEAVVSIEFVAPTEAGKYQATWQAYDPNGEPFGEWLTIEIGVTSP